MYPTLRSMFIAAVVTLPSLALASEPSEFFEFSAQAAQQKVPLKGEGQILISLKLKPGAHLSPGAPFKLALASKEVEVEKSNFSNAEGKTNEATATTTFSVNYRPKAVGPATVTGKATFYVCIPEKCLRETRELSVKVDII